MDLEALLHDPLARRTLFRATGAGVAGASATLLAACGARRTAGRKVPQGALTGPASTSASGDVAVLNSLLSLENFAIAAYGGAMELLKGPLLKLGKEFLLHEREHASALTEAIKQLGGTPNNKEQLYGFTKPVTLKEALQLVSSIENTAIAGYLDAIPKLSSPELRGTAAAIVTSEAEHLAELQGALKRPQAPTALVTGKS
jgi:bacterioferritin (cytochrome b1)